jgi:hypothetical protein
VPSRRDLPLYPIKAVPHSSKTVRICFWNNRIRFCISLERNRVLSYIQVHSMSNGGPAQESKPSKGLGKVAAKVVASVAAIAAVTTSLSGIAKDSNTILANIPFLKSSSTAVSLPSSSTAPSSAQSSADQVFYVIAGQSKYPDELRQEPKRAAGLEFTRSFPNIKICPSKVDSKTHYLVLGSNLSQAEAQAVKQQAIVNNFQSDTYIQTEKEIFFVPSSCSNVTG